MTARIRIYPLGCEPDSDPRRDLVRELLVIGCGRVSKPGGWIKTGPLHDPGTGAVSLIGAVSIADRQPWYEPHEQDRALQYLFDALPLGWRTGAIAGGKLMVLTRWNNASWRRQERVVRLFYKAIRRCGDD